MYFVSIGDSAGGHLAMTLALRWRRLLRGEMAAAVKGVSTAALREIKFLTLIYPATQFVNLSTVSYLAHRDDPMLRKATGPYFFTCFIFGRSGCGDARLMAANYVSNYTSAKTRARIAKYFEYGADIAPFVPPAERKTFARLASDPSETDPTGDAALEAQYAELITSEEVSPLFARDFSGVPPVFVATMGHDIVRDDGLLLVQRLREKRVGGERAIVEHRHYANRFHGWFSMRPEGLAADLREYLERNALL